MFLGCLLQRRNSGVQRGDGTDGLPPDEELPPDLRRRALKEPPGMGIAFKQRIQIGIQVHISHLRMTAVCAETGADIPAARNLRVRLDAGLLRAI